MKNLFYQAGIFALALSVLSCSSDDDNIIDDGPVGGSTIELTGNLTTQTLSKDNKYLLKGQVFVRDGQTVTIQPGTVIFGDKATRATLVVDRGGKIIANGTQSEPIVMTSSQPAGIRDRGDWGGLVILGKANVNQPNPAIEGITPEVNFGTTQSNELMMIILVFSNILELNSQVLS